MQDLRALERRVERLELAVFGHSSSRTTTTQRHHAHMYRQALERQASQGSILSQLAHLSLQWKRIQREHPELRLFLQKMKQHGSLFKVHEAGRARLIQVNSSLDWRTKVEVLRLGEHDLFRFLDGLHQCKSLSFVLDIPQLTSMQSLKKELYLLLHQLTLDEQRVTQLQRCSCSLLSQWFLYVSWFVW